MVNILYHGFTLFGVTGAIEFQADGQRFPCQFSIREVASLVVVLTISPCQ